MTLIIATCAMLCHVDRNWTHLTVWLTPIECLAIQRKWEGDVTVRIIKRCLK